jgi:hypothetical protein
MSANRYLPAARSVALAFPEILAQRGLNPPISRFVLTETEQGAAWLFVVLDVSPLTRFVETYTGSEILHHLSTELNGLPVVVNILNGLSYAVLLSPMQDFTRNFGLQT